jgi:metallopeptidase family M81
MDQYFKPIHVFAPYGRDLRGSEIGASTASDNEDMDNGVARRRARRDAYEQIKSETLRRLSDAGRSDGIVLANHGALEVSDLDTDGDTDFVLAIGGLRDLFPLWMLH